MTQRMGAVIHDALLMRWKQHYSKKMRIDLYVSVFYLNYPTWTQMTYVKGPYFLF